MNQSETANRSLATVTAAILAGGLGTRLRPVVADRPKVLAEVGGYPLLAHLLKRLADSGITRVVLCTGYLGDQVQAAFGNSYLGLSLAYSQESSPLGTAGALRLALPRFESSTVLVMNGDSLCRVNHSAVWKWHQAVAAQGTMVLTKSSDAGRYGEVSVDQQGRVRSFEEKGEINGGWINAGTYLLSRGLIESIPTGRCSLEREMFPVWIRRGLYGYTFTGGFLDIGTPESYALAEGFVCESAINPVRLTDSPTIESELRRL